jgi:hypothetical protein
LLSLALAAALYSRFGTGAHLWRDEAIYAYGGQQFAEGVPFYASIFDIKTPLASLLAGLGVLAGRAVGADDLEAIRVVFFLCACAAVVAVYLLALWLWRSTLAGLVAVAVFTAFRGFAIDAPGGPDAKTPAILFAVTSMALVVDRRWFWAALAGSLAFLVWQPLAIYAALAVVAAVLTEPAGRRRAALGRSLAGAALPLAVTVAYFWLSGALHEFVEAAFVFPVTGLSRGQSTLTGRLDDIVNTLGATYGTGRFLFWAGLLALPALLVVRVLRGRSDLRATLADPLVCVVGPSLAVIGVYSLIDFQGYPDLYPGLPYAALGVAGVAALVLERLRAPALRRAGTAAVAVAVTALAGLSLWSYSRDADADQGLAAQRASAATIERILDRGETLYALGDPTPLVLTRRRNPSRFIYLSSGVGKWVVKRKPRGFRGFVGGIRAAHPTVIVLNGWTTPLAVRTARWLERRYEHGYVGVWSVYLRPGTGQRALRRGIFVDGLKPPSPR